MSIDDQVLRLFAEANPVPDSCDLPFEPAGAVSTAVDRTGAMSSLQAARLESPASRSRRGVRVAAIAAAVVLVVGLVGVLIAESDRSQPPVTQAPASSVTPTMPAPLEVGDSAMDAIRTGDVGGYIALLADGAEFRGVTVGQDRAAVRNFLEFYAAVGRSGPAECRVSGVVVECDWAVSDAISGNESESLAIVAMVIEDGEVVSTGWEDYAKDPRNVFIDDLVAWLADTRPELWAGVASCESGIDCWPGATGWQMTAETGALLAEHAAEFKSAQ